MKNGLNVCFPWNKKKVPKEKYLLKISGKMYEKVFTDTLAKMSQNIFAYFSIYRTYIFFTSSLMSTFPVKWYDI